MFRAIARHHRVPVVVVNQVGGNDHIVFDGSSFAMDGEGNIIAVLRMLPAKIWLLSKTDARRGELHGDCLDETEAAYEALVLGTRELHSQVRISAAH